MTREDTDRGLREPFEFINTEKWCLPDGTRVTVHNWRRRDPHACFGTWAYRGADEPLLVLPGGLQKEVEERLIQLLAEALADQLTTEDDL